MELKETTVTFSRDNFALVSINIESLEKIKSFYEKLEKISDVSITRIFSPEEEVFEPYFSFLEKTYPYLIDNENIKLHFRKSITEYRERDYSHCISTVGLILEDYLIQVYETFFRDVCPKGLTLGELFSLIHSRINTILKPAQEPNPEIKPIYDLINNLIKANEQNSFNKELVSILREILEYIKKDRNLLVNMINTNRNKENFKSVFPAQLIDNIKEAIKNRNAISHKSTVPIGRYEALRTVYCSITLIIWWNNEKKKMDGRASKEEILKESIERNSHIGVV